MTSVNAFELFNRLSDEKEIPNEELPMRLNWNISSPESADLLVDLVQKFQELSHTGLKLTEVTKQCDACSKKLLLTDNSTALECERCGFVNDLCPECRSKPLYDEYVRGTLITKCFEGIGCSDPEREKVITRLSSAKEAPF
jgi:hypothetical protein